MTSLNVLSEVDFAYPEKVIKESTNQIEKAIKTNDTQNLIDGLTKLQTAKRLISYEYMPEVAKSTDSIANASTDKLTKSLLLAIEADMFSDMLNERRFMLYEREQTAKRPDDINQWAIEDFNEKIMELISASLADKELLLATPAEKFTKIIEPKEYDKKVFPTLYDLLAHHFVELLEPIANGKFPFPLWRGYDYYIINPITINPDKDANVMQNDILASLINVNAKNIPALIYTETKRIKLCISDKKRAYKRYIDLYKAFADNEYSTEPLIAATECKSNNINKQELYELAVKQIERFPRYSRIRGLKNFTNDYEAPYANINVQNTSTLGENLTVSVKARNIKNITLKAYKVNKSYYNKDFLKLAKNYKPIAVKSYTINYKFGQDTLTNLTFPALPKYGTYQFAIESNDNFVKKEIVTASEQVIVTDIDFLLQEVDGETRAYAINSKTGKPIQNASLYNHKNKLVGKSNRFGYVVLSDKDTGEFHFALGNDKSRSEGIYDYYRNPYRTYRNIHVCTDLGVYRPGDKVKFSFIAYWNDKDSLGLSKNQKFTVTLKDPNWKDIDKIKLTTDKYGRADSSFTLPKEGITGNFYIQVRSDNEDTSDYCRVTVSEYKAPTFFVEFDKENSNLTTRGNLFAKGKVLTFSKFPIADAKLKYSINSVAYSSDSYFEAIDGETTTDADGNWEVSIPDEVFNGNDFCYISLKITATAKSGETQEGTEFIAIGDKQTLNLRYNDIIEATAKSKIFAEVKDLKRNVIDAKCNYEIKAGNDIVKSGSFMSASPYIDLSDVKSGKYTLYVWTEKDSDRKEMQSEEVVIYRNSEEMPPYKTPLFVTDDKITCDDTGKAVIKMRSSYATSAYYAVYTDTRVIINGWYSLKPGLNTLTLNLNLDKEETAKMEIISIFNHKDALYKLKILPNDHAGELKIVKETFRDFINPNSKEVWRFRLESTGKVKYQGAMMAYMYDAALNQIDSNLAYLNFNIVKPTIFFNSFYMEDDLYCILNYSHKYLDYRNIQEPYFNRYYKRYYAIGTDYRKIMVRGAAMNSTACKEVLHESAVVEDKYETSSAFGVTDEEAAKSGMNGPKDDSLRDPDIKTAFFMPRLATNKDGVITLEFDAPNVNTTWQFCALAYTENLKSAYINETVTANKPIMVQANLPRFIRNGDRVKLLATVMNNSLDSINANVEITIFDPAKNKIIKSCPTTVALAPKASDIVEIEVGEEITKAYTGIGYRVKAQAGSNADGEQKVIAILPSTTEVIEAEPFYIKENEQSISKKLPKAENGTLTLEYCDNPVWYCVMAMPSMISENQNALAFSKNFYVTSISGSIVGADKSIADALNAWKDSETLKSNLNKNEELKVIDLNNSPWLNNAERETLSMQHVIDLTDPNTIDKRKEKAISGLKGLQTPDGGFRWFSKTDPSLFITLEVLEDFANLKTLGYLEADAELTEMLKKACNYVDAEIIKDIEKYDIKKNQYSGYFNYILIRDRFTEFELPKKIREIKKEVVDFAKKDWRKLSLSSQAEAAILLADNGYQSEAESIIESLRQKARKDDSIGFYWDLEYVDKLWTASKIATAFHKVNPNDSDINNIRRWILQTKETRNWGESRSACEAVNAILATGTRWNNSDRKAPEITIGSEVLNPTGDKFLGYSKFSFDVKDVEGKKLSIKRYGYNPAWGAIYLNYNAPMKDVAAKNSPDIKMEKTFYRYGDDGKLIDVPASDFKIGEKIQVRIMVTVKRDMNYVTITDARPAAFEPVDQVPTYDWSDGIFMLRETRDSATNIFINGMPKGTFAIKYDVFVNNKGTFNSGLANIQSLYAPQLVAHSNGTIITVE